MVDIDNAVSRWPEREAMEATIRKVFDGMPDHLARGLAESRSKYIDKNGVRKQLEALKFIGRNSGKRFRIRLFLSMMCVSVLNAPALLMSPK